MKAGAKDAKAPMEGGKWVETNGTPTSVSFGSVTVQVVKPPENVRLANIEAGQAAMQRGKISLVRAGVKISREKDTPLYFGCEDKPGFMIRELNGKKTLGKFVGGRFREVEEGTKPTARKQAVARK
ncbi:hypothetical protein FNU76_07730 [Chitinimonas arctica]|uniref:Uncharacterized protein n=1 Tax=Chitinimonas arctica TaxID=2594795 RepID=A0A516SE18_9NEIS|nr:hypothetical protein [Chitinimonas arctica]QDQ26258.1 hypothetical protein FNU76_07730 [Chitinimonas arctica]